MWIAAGVFCALLLVFHRPVILSLARRIAVHFAAGEHLKLDFQVEGNPFGSLTLRNVHAIPIGPADIESIDLDFAHVDYGLISLLRHGLSDALQNVDVRGARIVLNPNKRAVVPRPEKKKKKPTLFDIFPERVHVLNVTLVIRDRPHDFAMENVNLDLDPANPGELKIDKLQLAGGQTWLRINARTSYANRLLTLQDIVLAGDERIRSITLDASQIAAGRLSSNFEYLAGAGKLSGSIALREAQSSIDADAHLDGAHFPLGTVNKYAALPEGFVTGEIDTIHLDWKGLLSLPKDWNGTVAAQVSNFRQQGATFDQGTVHLSAQNGVAALQSADIVQGNNKIHLSGSIDLPSRVRDFGRTPGSLDVSATAPDLQGLTAGLSDHVTGSAELSGKVEIRDGKRTGEFSINGATLGFKDGSVGTANASIKLSQPLSPAESAAPWYVALQSETILTLSNLRFRDLSADTVEATLQSRDDRVTVEHGIVRRKGNEFVVSGNYRLPGNPGDFLAQPGDLNFSLKANELADYWVGDSADRVSGPLQMQGQLAWKDRAAGGQLFIYGNELRMRELVVHQLSAQCTIADSVLYLNDVTATLNQQDYVAATGTCDLRAPFRYRGKLAVNLADLSAFKPLLKASGNDRDLGGSFAIDWEGNGEGQVFKNSGKLKLTLDKGRYGQLKALQANVDAAYSPDGFNIPIIFFRSDKTNFQAVAQAGNGTLEINKIELNQGASKYAEGYVSIPFAWKNIGTNAPIFPADGKVLATFQSANLDIKKVFEDIGMKAPASGTVNVKLNAGGTLNNLDATFDLQMGNVRSETFPKLEPASFALNARAQGGQLALSGKLEQAKIQPLTLTASFPIPVTQILRERKLPDNTPIDAALRLPRSSVNFLRQFVPAIENLDGDLALAVDAKGTIAQPVLSGSGDITINVGRFTNVTLPALQNFKGRLVFNRDTLSLERFGGELAGGAFTLSGRVTFPKLTQANLDLQLKANSVLVARNDSMTVRCDADIKVAGPFNAANVTGNVALTNSHFLKNLDLIPIGLPGRPAPEPPESRPQFSIPQPPLRDWKFDVAIKTKDPFLIRGSLANGGALVDLHLGGNGLHPALDGQVRLENVEATLPFSRLEIQYGFLYFNPSDPLNPRIDLAGTSVIRDYTVRVYVYGTSLAPEAVFTSEPPLPQEDIISLLATGTTRQELTGNNNVLAGRAAMLLFQQVYRKIFKKGDTTKSNSVFDRLEMDVGNVDPRTGQQTATARFKINQQFVLIGDIEVGGDFRGIIKYLIRFH